jgi:hypothetical protein
MLVHRTFIQWHQTMPMVPQYGKNRQPAGTEYSLNKAIINNNILVISEA